MIKEQQEQEILKEFEELGYKINYFTKKRIVLINFVLSEVIDIVKEYKFYSKYDLETNIYSNLTIPEHRLLHKLFEIWNWI
jgi:hypothetical protein